MRTLLRYLLLKLPVVVVISVGLACGGGEQAAGGEGAAGEDASSSASAVAESGSEKTAIASAGPGYHVVDVSNGGTIKGVVRFVGTVPPPRVVEVREDVEACGDMKQVQMVNIGPNDGLADVVASLTDIQEGAALVAPEEPPEVDQSGCRFVPHVALVPVGTPLYVLNSDPITHNLHTLAFENRPLNKAQPSAVRKLEISFKVPEKVKLNCDIHEWMGAWIVVMGHPYHAKTGLDGMFAIENVPPGTYSLEVWHETLGTQTEQVTVAAGETTEVSFAIGPQS